MRYYQWNDSEKKIPIGKIICLARTYREHAEEMQAEVPANPVIFLKPSSAIIFSGESIHYPKQSYCLHHEIELGVVIGKPGKDIAIADADKHVEGYCVGLDITARDLQTNAKQQGLPWTIAKGFDTFAPISEVIDKKHIPHTQKLTLQLTVNGEQRQMDSTDQLIWSIPDLISFISSIMTLERGDLILTGTPKGVSEIKKGDLIKATMNDLCTLQVDVH